MFNYMLSTCEEALSQKLIKEYHARLKAGVFEDIANGYPIGEYKNRRNMVSDITTSSPENVKAEYYECLNIAQLSGEYEPLIRFFKEEQDKYAEMIKDFICPVE